MRTGESENLWKKREKKEKGRKNKRSKRGKAKRKEEEIPEGKGVLGLKSQR